MPGDKEPNFPKSGENGKPEEFNKRVKQASENKAIFISEELSKAVEGDQSSSPIKCFDENTSIHHIDQEGKCVGTMLKCLCLSAFFSVPTVYHTI